MALFTSISAILFMILGSLFYKLETNCFTRQRVIMQEIQV